MTDPQLDDDSYSWPSHGIPLFTSDTTRSRHRAILQGGRGAWYVYATSFRLAADILVEKFRATGYDQDMLAYPIVSLYRHHVELSLKALWLDLARYHGEDANPAEPRHSLIALWRECRRLHELVWPEDASDLDAVEGMIAELARVDPSSQMFRFPVDFQGRPHLPPEAETFDLLHFADEMTKLSHWFDGTNGMLDAYTDHQQDAADYERELEADYRAEMAAEASSW